MSASDTAPRFESLEKAAIRLACSTRTLRRYIAAGDVRAFRMGDRLIRVSSEDIDGLLRPIPTAGGDAA